MYISFVLVPPLIKECLVFFLPCSKTGSAPIFPFRGLQLIFQGFRKTYGVKLARMASLQGHKYPE